MRHDANGGIDVGHGKRAQRRGRFQPGVVGPMLRRCQHRFVGLGRDQAAFEEEAQADKMHSH